MDTALPSEILLGALMQEGGLVPYLKARAERDRDAARKLERLRELVKAVVEYERNAETPRLVEWLEQASLAGVRDCEGDKVRGHVTLATIHAAKGLEWPVVFVVGVEGGTFPSGYAETAAEVEEERRLCYVALTRARDELIVTGVSTRDGKARSVSPFLAELMSQAAGHTAAA
jgi:DNA helicase-2/ATP-dependent DNA helicase PcrA